MKKPSPSNRGSILVIAMIFGSLLLLSAGLLLKYGVSEKVVNERHFLRLEAQNAAESVVEYGFADLKDRWENKTSFTANELINSPLELPSTVSQFFGGSNINTDGLEITGGTVSNGRWLFIDPKDPSNQLDPQKQKLVFARDVMVYGRATANAPDGMWTKSPIDVYCAQMLQVRDSPLFGHAIFYNMDLEFHPGPAMDVFGPVHTNGDMYIQSDGTLKFHSTVMSGGNIFHSYKKDMARSSSHLGSVKIKTPGGSWKEMYKGSGDKMADSSYFDSNMGEDWKDEAENRWDGMVGSKDHEVPHMKPLNIADYIPDDPDTGTNELRNPAYALIEPQLPSDDGDYKGPAIQQEQFSYKAGLVLRVTENAAAPSGYDYNFVTYQRSLASTPNSARVLDGNGKPVEIVLDKTNLPAGLVSIEKYGEDSNGKPTSGFYDKRQLETMDVVELDIDLLRSTIDNTDPDYNSDAWNGSYQMVNGGAYDWNGIMYVETPYSSSAGGRPDKVRKAKSGIAVRLKNGSKIPSPSTAVDPGFTLATNAPLYVLGDYNADGSTSTGSATEPDSSSEKPAALIADAITILSNEWQDNDYDAKSKDSVSNRVAGFTEVSAAFLTGQSPTIPNSDNFSGGVHNFPRFLEKWSGKEFRYRGSLVALFESEVNWRHMRPNFSSWYSPPIRNWGFSTIFAGGQYPPGTPNTRDFRRRNFKFITAGEYAAALSDL
jgi:hypothetical protein